MELRNCPFCGGQARVCADGQDLVVRCHQCGGQGGEFAFESFAVEAWNARKALTPAPANAPADAKARSDGNCPTCAAEGKPHFGWCGWKYQDSSAEEERDGEGDAK